MQIYARVHKTTATEQRPYSEKSNRQGTYRYADVQLQLFDKNAQPGTHTRYNALTGEPHQEPDVIRCHAIHDGADAMTQMWQSRGIQEGDIVIADVTFSLSPYGHNEVQLHELTKYQPSQTPQP